MIRRFFRALGILMIVAGLAVIAWFALQYWGSNVVAQKEQERILDDWTNTDAIGVLHVPRFGADFEVPILPGGDLIDPKGTEALARGVAAYEGAAKPGEVGNFVVAGHRVTHGEPFADFPKLRAGDKVRVETRDAEYTYVLRDGGTDIIVPFTVTWPLWDVPDPDQPDVEPTERLMTMVTCSELFHTTNRSVVVAELENSTEGQPEPRPNVQRDPGVVERLLDWLLDVSDSAADLVERS